MFINFYICKIIGIQIGLLLEHYRKYLFVDFGLRAASVTSLQIRSIIDTVKVLKRLVVYVRYLDQHFVTCDTVRNDFGCLYLITGSDMVFPKILH